MDQTQVYAIVEGIISGYADNPDLLVVHPEESTNAPFPAEDKETLPKERKPQRTGKKQRKVVSVEDRLADIETELEAHFQTVDFWIKKYQDFDVPLNKLAEKLRMINSTVLRLENTREQLSQ